MKLRNPRGSEEGHVFTWQSRLVIDFISQKWKIFAPRGLGLYYIRIPRMRGGLIQDHQW